MNENEASKNDINLTSLRFVLYARKSTVDEGKQVQSIGDQIAICKAYANNLGLNIVEVIEEKQSAKYPGRPLFKKMMKAIGKDYDGILSYHPDRLSRNMLEAGLILNMLTPGKNEDEPVLKSLLFPTVSYSNDSGGRLMLAVLFSMATQYSEHLSEVVSRGVKSNFKRGISAGTLKWGYKINEVTRRYEPDKNFGSIKQGYEMILAGSTQKAVVEFWKKKKVKRKLKSGREQKINEKTISKMLKDPFYCGILIQAGDEIDLKKLPGYGFKPIITELEYDKIQASSSNHSGKIKKLTGKRTFLPFREILKCGECGKYMYSYVGKGHSNKQYGYVTCQNKACTRKKKTIRMKMILDGIYNCIDKIEINKGAYDEYLKQVDAFIDNELTNYKQERRSEQGKKNQINAEIRSLSSTYTSIASDKSTPKSVIDNMKQEIKAKEKEVKDIQDRIDEINNILNNTSLIKLNKKDFSNLLKTAKEQIRTGDLVQKDQIVKMLFSNLILDDKNKLTCILKKDFDGLLHFTKIQNGAP